MDEIDMMFNRLASADEFNEAKALAWWKTGTVEQHLNMTYAATVALNSHDEWQQLVGKLAMMAIRRLVLLAGKPE